MFALPGILLLLIVDYLKPQEYFTELLRLPLLHLATGLALFGFVVDIRLGVARLRPAPQLWWVAGFFLWGLLTVAVRAPDSLITEFMFIIQLSLFLLVGHALQSFRSLQLVIGALLAIGLFLAAVGVHQGMAPKGCLRLGYENGQVVQRHDGRDCATRAECNDEAAEPGAEYACEHVGLFGTSSVGGRVRYLGTLADPNELALALGVMLPFAFAFLDRRRSAGRILLLVLACGLIGLCAVLTQSRGGQLVVLAALGVYLFRRLGFRGLVIAGVLLLPMVLFGGRSGSESESSTEERLETWAQGWEMFRSSPLLGVGMGQFTQHHHLTAHSSYILSYAEQGFPGYYLFTIILYLSIKIPVMVLIRSREMARVAVTWSVSMLAAWIGLLVGIAFLSYTYKEQLWIFIGLTGALYHCVKAHVSDFHVGLGWGEAGLLAVFDVALILFLHLYTVYKGVAG